MRAGSSNIQASRNSTHEGNSLRSYGLSLTLVAALLLAVAPASARQTDPDSLWEVEMREVVVTATKGPRSIRNVPVPTQVLTAQMIREQGASRLADLLAEHPGLVVTNGLFGSGIQLQGFDAAYTLILVDGDPIIGREGGVIDLDRLPVGDIERIEIVRGPSSSLYGSEALAGVINIITKRPAYSFDAEGGMRYETHGTTDLNLSLESRTRTLGSRFSVNRFGSQGYDLVPDVPGLTAPSFTDLATGASLDYDPTDRTSLRLTGRWAQMDQRSTIGFSEQAQIFTFDEEYHRWDWNVGPVWEQKLVPGTRLTTRLFAAGSGNSYTLLNRDLAESSERTDFAQWYRKGESQLDAVVGLKHFLTLGAGYITETVEADRVEGGRRSNRNGYGYAQHQWFVSDAFQIHTSARLDWHSEYATRLSPKVALLWNMAESLRIRASVGSGFKAPTFQQLYMDFTNPVAGYSVVGSSDIVGALADFEALGQISSYLTDPAAFAAIRPESSVAFNAGIEWDLPGRTNLQVNVFRNEVKDLIEHQPVAAKPNGQYVFTYVNLQRIYTQGLEAEFTWRPLDRWSLSTGYQWLDARDQDVLGQIDAGSLYKRVGNRDYRLTRGDYGGLFNRSRHSGSIRLTYRNEPKGYTANLRVVYRSRYGFGDLNGNLILDDVQEYVPGHALVNATVSDRLNDRVTAQFGVKNVFDVTYPTLVPSLPGRLLYAGFTLSLR